MSNWKVSKQKIALFPHENADKLELARIGSYQCVVQKGLYVDGDEVVFAPEKSVLTGKLQEEWAKWLAGPNKDRVKATVMRGEYSCGIIIPKELLGDLDIDKIEIGQDVSEQLGISHYIPPIPQELTGIMEPIVEEARFGKHDCEQFSVYANEFTDGERIVVTEKLHGSQAVFFLNYSTGEKFVTTKNQLNNGLKIIENESNSYWKAAKSMDLWNLMVNCPAGIVEDTAELTTKGTSIGLTYSSGGCIQVFGELLPIQKGFGYGLTDMTVKIFDVRVDGVSVPYDKVGTRLQQSWVPIIYDGPIDKSTIRKFAEGMETVSGKALHIKEGVVVAPYVDRKAPDGTRLRLKILNTKYKEVGEEIN